MNIINRLNLSILTFIVVFLVYILTLAPDVTFTDAGELAGVCSTLGIAHPTGYPLFTILGFLWVHLPLPFSKIYSLNLLTALLTALAAVNFFNLTYFILQFIESNKNRLVKTDNKSKNKKKQQKKPVQTFLTIAPNGLLFISFITALTFGFAQTIWEQALSIEVYSLHVFMFTLILRVLFKAVTDKQANNRMFLLAAFLLGLGFTNHMTTLLLVPAILFFYFKRPGEPFIMNNERLKNFALLILPFLLGLSLYIYMPLRSAQFPDFNWGWVSRSFAKFYYHISGKQYQIWMFTGGDSFSANLSKFFELVPWQVAWIGLLPVAYGFYRALKASWELFTFILLLVIGCLAYSLNYSIHDIETYFILAFAALILFMAVGILGIVEKFPKAVPLFIIIPIISLGLNYTANNETDDYMVPEYTRIMTDNLKPNAIVISRQWDYFCSAFWYKQKVEGWRPDVVLVEKELLRRTWYLEQFKRWYPQTAELSKNEMDLYLQDLEAFESGNYYDPAEIQERYINMLNSFIDKNYGKRPIYVTLDVLEDKDDEAVGAKYEKIPEGFALRLEKSKESFPVNVDNIYIDKFVNSLKGREGHLVEGIKTVASANFTNIGRYAMLTNQKDQAIKALKKAIRINPANRIAIENLQQLGE